MTEEMKHDTSSMFDELRSEIDAGVMRNVGAYRRAGGDDGQNAELEGRISLEVYDYLQRRAEEIAANYTPEPCGRCAMFDELLKTLERLKRKFFQPEIYVEASLEQLIKDCEERIKEIRQREI